MTFPTIYIYLIDSRHMNHKKNSLYMSRGIVSYPIIFTFSLDCMLVCKSSDFFYNFCRLFPRVSMRAKTCVYVNVFSGFILNVLFL